MPAQSLIKRLPEFISGPRLKHSMATSRMAIKLAGKYGVGKDLVLPAALLHDCARELGDEELLQRAAQEGLAITELEKEHPVFLHGPVGAIIAREDFGIDDPRVWQAIAVHTTGAVEMGPLDKIIYIADKIEEGRNYAGVERLRELAFQDLDVGLLACLEHNIKYSLEKGIILPPEICYARNSVLKDLLKTRR